MAGHEKLQQSLNLLIAREEDLRFTSHTKLVLETIMIKLCRLGEVLSFDELIRKIETLEKRLSSCSPSGDNMSVGHLSDPGSNWETEEKGKDGPDMQGDKPKREDWDDLLTYLSSRNRAMSNVLKEWCLVNLTSDTLEIARGNSSFSSSYLDEPERLNNLADYCQKFFKRDIKIKILDNKQNNNKKMDLSKEEKPDLPRPVQDVLQIFQGKIKGEVS